MSRPSAAAEAVAPDAGPERAVGFAVLDLIAQLVERSVVVAVEDGTAVRYQLLETIRQYAAARLADAGRTNDVKERHLDHCLQLPAVDFATPLRWDFARLEEIARDHDNLRVALEWALDKWQRARSDR